MRFWGRMDILTSNQNFFIFNANTEVIHAYSENLGNTGNHSEKTTHNSATCGYPSLIWPLGIYAFKLLLHNNMDVYIIYVYKYIITYRC